MDIKKENSSCLIGGIGLSWLEVYNQRPAPDGQFSGCAHVHSITEEAYLVCAGSGYLELHDMQNGFRTVNIQAGDYLHFSAQSLHRVVAKPELKIVVIMGNAGLAERGDARIYFGPAVDADEKEFKKLLNLPSMQGLEGALARRDASVKAYMQLLELHNTDKKAYFKELTRFVTLHCQQAYAQQAVFAAVLKNGPEKEHAQCLSRLQHLPQVATNSFAKLAQVAPVKFGMCGLLKPIEAKTL